MPTTAAIGEADPRRPRNNPSAIAVISWTAKARGNNRRGPPYGLSMEVRAGAWTSAYGNSTQDLEINMDMRAIRWAMYGVAAMGMGTLATPAASAAETTLTHVHVCCNSCKKAVDAAITGAGARANIEKNTVTITADDEAGVKKAVAAMLAAGYYGQGAPTAPASDVKAKSVTVEGAHLCCKKCVAAFNKAVKAAGATKTDAEKDEKSVTVEGDLSPKEVQEALHKAGFNATVK